MIVPGILVCISFLISVSVFIVSKALLISSATVIVRAGWAIWLNPLVRCCLLLLFCLPTPLTLVCGGCPIIPFLVHRPVYPFIWPQLHHSSGVCPQIQVWQCGALWVKLKRWCVSSVWVLQKGHSDDGCDLPSTLCNYDLRKGDLFVLSWARVQRVSRGCISSGLLMCGGVVCSILLLPLVARCLESIYVCKWHMLFLCVL